MVLRKRAGCWENVSNEEYAVGGFGRAVDVCSGDFGGRDCVGVGGVVSVG